MKKKLIKVVLFLVILAIGTTSVSGILTNSGEETYYQRIPGFFAERKDSLDAVYLGSSIVYSSWIAPLAWEHYGIAVYPFLSGAQPFAATEDLIRAARTRQPDALYIVPLNLDNGSLEVSYLHYLLDCFPNTKEKFQMARKLLDLGEYPEDERLEFYFPLLRYHSRWSELTDADFLHKLDGYKGGSHYINFLSLSVDVTSNYHQTERRAPLLDSDQKILESLLDYCDAEHVKVLFVVLPMGRWDESLIAQSNTATDMVSSRGYPVCNMSGLLDEIGMDFTADYYNYRHTNCHGAAKITHYLSRYLVEHYGFEDKRGDPAYADWEQAYEDYLKVISAYGCDFEWNGAKRDYTLAAPELNTLGVNGTSITLSWKAVGRAEGYCVYRKDSTEGSILTPIADINDGTLSYVDADREKGVTYTYTVVPYREENGVRCWGKYNLKGVSAKALMDAPQNLTNSGTYNELTLTWDPVPGADGYEVSRRVYGKTWVSQTGENTDTSYVDTAMLEDLPYQYRVRAFQYNDAGDPVYGSWSGGTLYVPQLPAPDVKGSLTDGIPTLSWPAVEGITGYTVSRRADEAAWEEITDPLKADATAFSDITAKAGVPYEYQVTAYLTYGNERYEYPSEPAALTAEAEQIRMGLPEILFCEQVGGAVQLIWAPAENATAYRIYRQAEGESEWTTVKALVTGSTFQDKPPKAGNYTYMVQSLNSTNGCVYYGPVEEADGAAVAVA